MAQAESGARADSQLGHQFTVLSPDYLLTEFAAAQVRYDLHVGRHFALGVHAGPSMRPGVLADVAPLVYGIAYGGQVRGGYVFDSGVLGYLGVIASAQRNRFTYLGYEAGNQFFRAAEVDVEIEQRGVELDLGFDFPLGRGLRFVVEGGVFTGRRGLFTDGELYPNRDDFCLFCERQLEPNESHETVGLRGRIGLGYRL